MNNKTKFIIIAAVGATLISFAIWFAVSSLHNKRNKNVEEKDIHFLQSNHNEAEQPVRSAGDSVVFENSYVDSLKKAQGKSAEAPALQVEHAAASAPVVVQRKQNVPVKRSTQTAIVATPSYKEAPKPDFEQKQSYDYHDLLRGKIQSKEGVITSKTTTKADYKQVSDATKQNEYLQVIISNDTKVRSGKKIILRVVKGAMVSGVDIKTNSFLYALAQEAGDKYKLVVEQILTESGVLDAHLSFYDLQGFEGIKKGEKSNATEIAKNSATSLGSSALALGGGVVGAVGSRALMGAVNGNTHVEETIIPGGLKGYLK